VSYLPPEDNFEDSLEKVFGDRARDFSPELRRSLRELWRCGREQGSEDARLERQRLEIERMAMYEALVSRENHDAAILGGNFPAGLATSIFTSPGEIDG
jgi:hypothetical protein